MSTEPKLPLKSLAVVITVLVGSATLLAYWRPMGELPNRMTAAERRLDALEADRRADRELLVRIDENVKALKEAQGKR
jgi:hypothetical protein